jgi:hypothetical protein
MNREDVIQYLKGLTDKQFIDLFYEACNSRNIYTSEPDLKAHLILANAFRDYDASEWEIEILCPTPGQEWADDALVCQFGMHCGYQTASWSKNSICPICGDEASGT